MQRIIFHPLLLFVLALLLRLNQLGTQSLWLDEGSTWSIIQQGWGVLLGDMVNPVSAYPLYHLLLKGWVALAGDSEWALRFPSAVAGAGAVVALYAAAREVTRHHLTPATRYGAINRLSGEKPLGAQASRLHPGGQDARAPRIPPSPRGSTSIPTRESPAAPAADSAYPVVAALLLLLSPFAIWYAQEVKVYSLFLLLAALLLWSLLRVLRRPTRRGWLLFGGLALVSLFVHRLALLLLLATYAAVLLHWLLHRRPPRRALLMPVLLFVLLSTALVVAMVGGLGEEGAATGAHIPAGPLLALWLTFVRFSVDRGPGEFPWWWLLPWAALTLWGGAALLHTVGAGLRQRRPPPTAPLVLLCFLVVPLVLFLIQLAFTRFYEARYLMPIVPAWVALLAYPLRTIPASRPWGRMAPAGAALLSALALLVGGAVLLQPRLGLLSGYPVKEQYRAGVARLAERVHPDDLVVLQPSYLQPLYDYYMHRLSADPPPAPALFADFKQGQTEFTRREWDVARHTYFAGHTRSFLLIAPEHARTVDIPNTEQGDEYGLVGLYYQYSREQKKWPCGIWRYHGAHLYCQESPEAYVTGDVPHPTTPVQARFGNHLTLFGYTLKPTDPARPGVYRAGGVVPLSLYWEVDEHIEANYRMFLHLCRDCDMPPAASQDGQPLEGYLPTSVWLPGKPARDDRAIPLPEDMPPGRYTLLLGVYYPSNPMPEARVPVRSTLPVLEHHRLVLGEVEVVGANFR